VLSSLIEDKLKNTDHNGQNVNIYYFHPDHLGSSSYITNGLGNVIQHIGRKCKQPVAVCGDEPGVERQALWRNAGRRAYKLF